MKVQQLMKSSDVWIIPVAALALILGFMMRMAWITESTRSDRLGRLDPIMGQRIGTGSIDVLDQFKKLREEVTDLRKKNAELESSMGNQTKSAQVLNDSLKSAREFSAISPVSGQGVIVTLSDMRSGDEFAGSDQIIHDIDVLKVVNELWAAGAEAISVGNHRVGPRTSFRCVGPVIHVDAIPVASPVVIRAIGDSETLFGALELPGGVLSEIRSTAQEMVKLEKARNIALPEYKGATTSKVAKEIPQGEEHP